MIRKPQYPRDHPTRFPDCQLALEDRIIELLGDAVISGWDRDEVLEAIIAVTENTSLAFHATERISVETQLRRFRKKPDI